MRYQIVNKEEIVREHDANFLRDLKNSLNDHFFSHGLSFRYINGVTLYSDNKMKITVERNYPVIMESYEILSFSDGILYLKYEGRIN